MRLVSLTVLFASVLVSIALVSNALADGGSATKNHPKIAPPHAQRNVVVTMEHGVRVWRPIATYSNDDAGYYPQATSYANPTYGIGDSIYGPGDGPGLGRFAHGRNRNALQHRHAYGVTVLAPVRSGVAFAQVSPIGGVRSRPVNVNVNIVGPLGHQGAVGFGAAGRGGGGYGRIGGGHGHGGGGHASGGGHR